MLSEIDINVKCVGVTYLWLYEFEGLAEVRVTEDNGEC